MKWYSYPSSPPRHVEYIKRSARAPVISYVVYLVASHRVTAVWVSRWVCAACVCMPVVLPVGLTCQYLAG